jgi:hypothetical protein
MQCWRAFYVSDYSEKTQTTSQVLFLPCPKLKPGICCHSCKSPSLNQIIVAACCSNFIKSYLVNVCGMTSRVLDDRNIYLETGNMCETSRIKHMASFASLSISCNVSLFFHSIQFFDPVKPNIHHIQILKTSRQPYLLRKLSLLKINGLMRMWKKMM